MLMRGGAVLGETDVDNGDSMVEEEQRRRRAFPGLPRLEGISASKGTL
jgi:hypothetical protein